MRCASSVSLLPAKAQDEATALQLCQAKVQVRRLPIEVIVAEYQWFASHNSDIGFLECGLTFLGYLFPGSVL